jgi:hypothetical protein
MLDRDRLRNLLDQIAQALTPLIEQSIMKALQHKSLPPTLILLARSMVDRPQIHSTVSAALTGIDELSDEECLALLRWIQTEIAVLTVPPTFAQSRDEAARHAREIADEYRAAAAPAIVKLQLLMVR